MNKYFLGIVFVMLIFLTGNVLALGITPGRTSVDFKGGLSKEISFSVLNSEHKKMNIVFMVQGDLSEYIGIFEGGAEFLPSEESKSFRYELNLPDKLEPGLHTGEIVVIEVPDVAGGGTFVGATVSVVSQLHVNVPYPGKYVDIDFNALDADQNSTATFIIPVVNRGKVGIGEVRGVIDIFTSLNEKLDSVETDFTALDALSRTELSAKWRVDVPSGNYLARVSVFYDGESKQLEKQFAVGVDKLSIESILINQFRLGEIAKLQILVENRWNQELESVFANLLVFDKDGGTMADVKSANEVIPALSKKELIAYWDTVGIEEGEYDGKLVVKYGEKSSDKNLLLKISDDALDITGVGYAIRGSGGSGFSLVDLLVILVVMLIVVNLAWFVFFKRFMKRRKG